MVALADFVTLVETFIVKELALVGSWVATQKLTASGPAVNTLAFSQNVAGKKLSLSYKLGLDGATVIEIAYDVFSWVTSNPQVIAFVQNLVQNWISSHLPSVTPPAPVANTK